MANREDDHSNEIEIRRDAINADSWQVLNPEILEILRQCHLKFEKERQVLLLKRKKLQARWDSGELPHFEKNILAAASWKVAPIPLDLQDRRVEITGPVNSAKMVITMINGTPENGVANTAMLDFEDSMNPTWKNVIDGVLNVIGAVNGTLRFVQPQTSGSAEKVYQINKNNTALPMVRVRGLHLNEDHISVKGQPISAGLFDLVLCASHTIKEFQRTNRTPVFYIPKCESSEEAKWWNDLFRFLEEKLTLKVGTLRTTVLIETLPAALQMEEILFEMRERATGLNVGRWDKIFSDIKVLKLHSTKVLADRASINLSRPWMKNYAQLLVQICHKHGAFAMGGMSAFVPGKDPETRKKQAEKVLEDKKFEADMGHDGCWVSHPFFIDVARSQFKQKNQLNVTVDNHIEKRDLLPDSSGPKTIQGLRNNIRVGIAYIVGWREGLGCVALDNLMEDLATLEISRAQVWQWLKHGVTLDDGAKVDEHLINGIFLEETQRLVIENSSLGTSKEANNVRVKYSEAGQLAQAVFTLSDFFPSLTEALHHLENKEIFKTFFNTKRENNHYEEQKRAA